MAETFDLETWGQVIGQIEKKINRIEQESRTEERSERQRFYSEAAAQFRYFKDAWRNHVSHNRAKYDEREARRVWEHVRDFMEHLAESES
jgi:hypothetical protein